MFWFISIVMTVYGFVNFYIFWRMKYFLGGHPLLYKIILLLFITWSLSYPVGRILEIWVHNGFQRLLIHIGSFWLAYFVYLLLGTLLFDITTMVLRITPYQILLARKLNYIYYASINGLIILFLIIGNINANRIRTTHLTIQVFKKHPAPDTLRIALITDIHLGTIIQNSFLEKIVERVNREKPDLILLGGDIIDEDINSVIEGKMGSILHRFQTPLGVYAITGNHEYISREVKMAEKYLRDAGIIMLRDSTIIIDNKILLAGREDRASRVFKGYIRKSIPALIHPYKTENYLSILLDHQPFHLEEAEQAGFDLQLSGHTHHGQMFPFQFITNRVYEKSWGYYRKGKTHYYISCGVGTWGPRIRLGNHPEIVIIDVVINKNQISEDK